MSDSRRAYTCDSGSANSSSPFHFAPTHFHNIYFIYMCVNERQDNSSGTVKMQGKEVAKVEDFKYLGSTVQRNRECGREVKKRVQAGWNGWRRMSGVICDRRVPARVKGKVYKVAVRPAMLYGLDTVALTKRQEAEMEVAELKMLRFSLGVTRMDKIRNE